MKFMLLIHQGTTPIPGSDAWDALSDDEKNGVYAAYQAVNQTPGFTPGEQLGGPDAATTVRAENGAPQTTQGAIEDPLAGYGFFEADDLDAAVRAGGEDPSREHGRRRRGAAAGRLSERDRLLRARTPGAARRCVARTRRSRRR